MILLECTLCKSLVSVGISKNYFVRNSVIKTYTGLIEQYNKELVY